MTETPLAPEHWVDREALDVEPPPLRRRWHRRVTQVAEAMFASASGPPPAARLRWLAYELDDFLSRVGTRSRLVFRFALFAATWLAPLWALRVGPLGWWSIDRRLVALERYETSTLGPTLLVVKAILCILYYEHPDAAREIGMDGGCLHAPEADGAEA